MNACNSVQSRLEAAQSVHVASLNDETRNIPLCRLMSPRMRDEQTRLHIVLRRLQSTEAFHALFGAAGLLVLVLKRERAVVDEMIGSQFHVEIEFNLYGCISPIYNVVYH